MNKRQYKKYKKKLCKRKYCDVRQERIFRIVEKYRSEDRNDLLYIVDSKRMDLKHPISIKLFNNIYPVGSSTDIINEKEIEFEFDSSPVQNYLDHIDTESIINKYSVFFNKGLE